VRDPTADHRADVFAANRARGRIALVVASSDSVTRPRHVAEEGSLRVRFPGARTHGLEAVTVNTAGGIAGGDHFDVAVAVEEGARLSVTTTAAEKVYRSLGPAAAIDLRLTVKSGATLFWLPQETILFDRARLRRTIEADVATDAYSSRRPSCSAAPPWAKPWSMAACSTAGVSAATASSALPRRCGWRARWPRRCANAPWRPAPSRSQPS
jgi:hypothetical protein